LIAEHQADLSIREDTRWKVDVNVWSPVGVVWRATGCHSLSTYSVNDRLYAWASLLADLELGDDVCDTDDCETCQGVGDGGLLTGEAAVTIAPAQCPGVSEYGRGLSIRTVHAARCCELFAAARPAEAKRTAMMTVRVPDRRHSPVGHATIREVTIAATCPVCGGPRGVPFNHNFSDDGEWMACDRWANPCGHLDTYEAVLIEAGV
jgi:hypothetical protein